MNNFRLKGVLVFSFLILKSFYSSNKRKKINQKPIEIDGVNQKLIEPEISKKNKWLYPTDEFGKMEKGRV